MLREILEIPKTLRGWAEEMRQPSYWWMMFKFFVLALLLVFLLHYMGWV